MKKYWKKMDQSLFTIKNLVEMFKIKNAMSPAIVWYIFAGDGNLQNLIQQNDFLLPYIQMAETYLS